MRYSSIDILRTIAIVLMVLVHFMENLAGKPAWNPAGFGAPFFAFLSGVSYSLWLQGRETKTKSEELISKITIRRGLFLIGLGFLFNILVWLPEDVFNWDVLTFIGSAILVLNFVRRLPPAVSVFIALLLCVFSPVLQKLADYDLYWTDGYFSGDFTLTDIFIGYFFTGYFPLFPWLALPLIGFTCGNYMLSNTQLRIVEVRNIAFIGTSLVLMSLLLQYFHSSLPAQFVVNPTIAWTMFPPSLSYLSGTIGMTLLSLATLHTFVDHKVQNNADNKWLSACGTLSRHSLTIYILHHLAHIWPMWVYALWEGQEPTYYWGKAMELYLAITLAFIFLGVCFIFLRWLDKTGRHGIEYWMRWLCD